MCDDKTSAQHTVFSTLGGEIRMLITLDVVQCTRPLISGNGRVTKWRFCCEGEARK